MMPNAVGVWGALGTPRAVRIVTVLMILYAVIIGGLVVGYASVSRCLAAYSDDNAASTAIRARAAADDRILNERERIVDQSDRARLRADQTALLGLVRVLLNPESTPAQSAAAIRKVEAVNTESIAVFEKAEKERATVQAARFATEAQRAAAPAPPPPSETC